MRTYDELKSIFRSVPWSRTNAHVHTHLCDGKPEMTVQNIGEEAKRLGIELIVLTPHFHRHVEDATEALYEDSSEEILWRLRDEIDQYASKENAPRFLLSTEADILSVNGEISLNPCERTVEALDCITPTMNYNPALPLYGVHLTYGRDRDGIFERGEYAAMAEKAGGKETVLKTMYETEINALLHMKYPSIIGHVFASHSFAGKHNWFGMEEKHLPIMKSGARKLIETCRDQGALIDITGIIRPQEITVEEHTRSDGFLYDFQKWFLAECMEKKVMAVVGSDSHSLAGLGGARYYGRLYEQYETAFNHGNL